jgi:hypothetical protein
MEERRAFCRGPPHPYFFLSPTLFTSYLSTTGKLRDESVAINKSLFTLRQVWGGVDMCGSI